ncbi:ABC transporter ATP-binding protein [Limnoglobus roseus]|uniref:ABC transporter ATP-binding protein n=1 Tax=Limnoglobus roseus TaxID=2598579 RepID=A0A5C1ALM6_9BACT|nr:ABC transporter ATP-binding protein [Limnoglobus roseus]QEL20111.1 ABC transporter ATP-binding protein [Limnoglobus roseus]
MAAADNLPSLRAVHLLKTFGDGASQRTALRKVSLNLFPGQLALLMGPSGSGKSTLLAILSGLLHPDGGQVLTRPNDQTSFVDIWGISEAARDDFRRKHTGFIFQGYNLFPALSASQQLEIVLKWGNNLSPGEARRQAEEMLDRLGLLNQRHKKPAAMSGGEKQRVAIGRALVKNPTFLFADEPTSALDWENGQAVIQLLRDAAHSRGATIFVVSHDARMLPFVDVCFHLDDGNLEEHEIPLVVAGE